MRVLACVLMVMATLSTAMAGEINADLMAAVTARDASRVHELVDKGYLVVAKRKSGEAALRFCASVGDLESMKKLLNHKCDPDAVERDGPYEGWTALVHAIVNGRAEAVRLLLEAGADPEIKPDAGEWEHQAPLSIAVALRRLDMAHMLLDAGAKRHRVSGKLRKTPLMIAAESGDVALLALFLKGDDKPDRTDRNGWTALFYAVQSGCFPCVRALVEAGADINRRDKDHVSVLQYAGNYVTRLRHSDNPPEGLEEIIPFLKAHGAK